MGGHLGITPAWAGKRVRLGVLCLEIEDHPRMGGEKADTEGEAFRAMGSPPHGRGKECSETQRQSKVRITPAWAGKSLPLLSCAKACEDHPRMGGEKHAGAL